MYFEIFSFHVCELVRIRNSRGYFLTKKGIFLDPEIYSAVSDYNMPQLLISYTLMKGNN